MKKRISFRTWLSFVTLALIVIILFFAKDELVYAWNLLGKIDFVKLVWIFPVIVAGYLSSGEMIFSYLRQKGFVKDVRPLTLARVSLELNFVNHAFPSGGVSGISYVNWRLGKYGVPSGRATMAQLVRYVVGLLAVGAFLVVSVFVVTIDGGVNRWIILMSSGLVFVSTVAMLLGFYFLSSLARLRKLSRWLANFVNRIGRKFSKKQLVKEESLMKFFDDLHDDFIELRQDKKLLYKPFLWALVFTVMEILPYWITFQALGMNVNPAPILIGYGLACFAGFFVATPGGSGAYEAIMVGVLALSGAGGGQAIAGVVFYRVIALLAALVLGYVFYQLTIVKYGRKTKS